MPSRTPRPQLRLPTVFAGFWRLPQSEVARRVFVVLVYIDARAIRDAGEVLLRELAVFRESGNAEIPRTIFSFVGNILLGKALYERHHLINVLRCTSDNLRMFDRQCIQVFKKRLFEAWR